jgi:hypothetical protein
MGRGLLELLPLPNVSTATAAVIFSGVGGFVELV